MLDLRPVVPGLTQIELGVVNAFLLEAGGGGLVLVDTGSPGSAPRILDAVADLGYRPTDVRDVIVTHHHPDHAGSLAAVLRTTGAQAWMHPADAAEVRRGVGFRPYKTASGLLNHILERTVIRPTPPRYEPAEVVHEVTDGDALPGGLVAVHAPGHSRGQLALVWPERRVLIAADACSNLPVLGHSIVYEDLDATRRTLRRLGALDVETAVFGHGKPIPTGAAARLRQRFG